MSTSSGSRSKSRPTSSGVKRKVQQQALDSEGTPDFFRAAIKRLKAAKTLDEPVREPKSMDWRVECKPLQVHLKSLELQSSFIPRVGEVVLWTPCTDYDLVFDQRSETYQMYSRREKRFLEYPDWRAGTIGQTPEEPVVQEDLVEPVRKRFAVNYSGFRVETFPDPNDDDKSLSLQSKYIHINCIRPFYFWPIFLYGIPQEKWHPSIKYAMTVMSSFSLVGKQRFKGEWPNASVYSQGIFLGPELLILGDVVRLKPPGAKLGEELPPVTDVMVIDQIEIQLLSCIERVTSPLLASKHRVYLYGRVYSLSPGRAYRAPGMDKRLEPLTPREVVEVFQKPNMNGYGSWYAVHPPGTSLKVSLDMIIGRCWEPDAMKLAFGSTSLGLDLHGMLASQQWSRQTDNRMEDGQKWFWADSRTLALGIDSLNGEDVAGYNEARDPKMWRKVLAKLDHKSKQPVVVKSPNKARKHLGNKDAIKSTRITRASAVPDDTLTAGTTTNGSLDGVYSEEAATIMDDEIDSIPNDSSDELILLPDQNSQIQVQDDDDDDEDWEPRPTLRRRRRPNRAVVDHTKDEEPLPQEGVKTEPVSDIRNNNSKPTSTVEVIDLTGIASEDADNDSEPPLRIRKNTRMSKDTNKRVGTPELPNPPSSHKTTPKGNVRQAPGEAQEVSETSEEMMVESGGSDSSLFVSQH